MHKIRKGRCEREKERRSAENVQRLIGELEWEETGDEEGGITWIELFAMYAIHGGCEGEDKKREKDSLAKGPMLQNKLRVPADIGKLSKARLSRNGNLDPFCRSHFSVTENAENKSIRSLTNTR